MPNVVRTVAMCTIINNTWSIATVPSPLLLSPRGHKFCYRLPVGTNFQNAYCPRWKERKNIVLQ